MHIVNFECGRHFRFIFFHLRKYIGSILTLRTDCFLSVEKIQERLQHCGLFLLPQLETARGE